MKMIAVSIVLPRQPGLLAQVILKAECISTDDYCILTCLFAGVIETFVCSYREPSNELVPLSTEANEAVDELGDDASPLDRLRARASAYSTPAQASDALQNAGYTYAALALDLAARSASDAVVRLEDLLLVRPQLDRLQFVPSIPATASDLASTSVAGMLYLAYIMLWSFCIPSFAAV